MLKKQDVQPSLKVRIRRLFLYLFLTFLGILLIFIILVMNNISKSLENESELFSSLVSSIVESDSESIKTLAQDYSLWDDMYYYVQSQNKEFENKYLNINYLQKFGIEFVGVYSFEKPVFISSVNHSLNFFLANMKIDINKASHFFEMPPGSSFPIEIYAYPIARTVDVKRSNPIGIFVVGRLLDIEEILKLEKKTASKITFETKYRKTKNTFNETITFSKAFKNSKGEVIGYLVCEKTSLVFRSVLINAIFLTLAFSTLFLVFMLILGPSIAKSVILPLHDIEYSIKNNTPDSVEKYIYQSDEVGELARAIKQYLIQREQINVYLKELESKNASLRALNEEVRRLLEKDVLTGLLTRYVFNSQIERLYVTSKVDRIPLSAIAIDADNFKKINDTFGHAIGDEVLKKIGEVILRNIRMSDFPIRMGGEEILILLPEADINAAYSIAERIRRKVEEEFQNLPYKATISLGVTQLRGDDTIETFLRRADDALYISKSNGKNRTSML
ncbi:MAG: diguanylate cyclase [Fervidobacterium sp.]|nr:diguanylate cyclase [Fervidobacterium sp.]